MSNLTAREKAFMYAITLLIIIVLGYFFGIRTLNNKYEEYKAELNELKAFKLAAENEQKDKLIQSFYMLSDEDKKEVVENKAKYSLEDIESKLSVICVRKKVSFDNQEEEKNDVSVTFSLDDSCGECSTPAWISAIKNTQKNKNKY